MAPSVLGEAQHYAALGWPVFPCKPGSKEPATPHGFRDATLDPAQIRATFASGGYNIGLAIPPCRFVVDVDGPAALDSMKALDLDLPSTATQRTPRGGWHFVYALPPGIELRQTAGEIATGVDTRAAGRGYIVAAPSKVNGKPYRWEVPPLPENIAVAPAWLIERTGSHPPGGGNGGGPQSRSDLVRVLAGVAEGQRDAMLFRYACKLHHGGRPREEAEVLIRHAARECQPPFPEIEALRKIEQAYGYPSGKGPALSRLRRLSDVQPETVTFLWAPYIPLRKLTMLEGDPGQGKSWLMAAIAASGSLGLGLPGMGTFVPFRSIIFTVEDGLADTLRPRLDAMGADCSLILAHPEAVNLSTPEGLAELERDIEANRPRLVVIDPIVGYVGSGTDTYRANEVRGVLAPLAALAEMYECAIVAVRHLSKAKGGRSIYAGQGSIDFTAAARSVLLAGSAADNPGQRALVHIKCNVAEQGPSLGYSIADGRFAWTGETTLTAADLLASEVRDGDRSAEEEAAAFLQDILADGPVDAKLVQADAKRAGIAERTLKRAKRRLEVRAQKRGFGESGAWVWSLPATTPRLS
jgi:hypothetical protein